MAVGCGVARPQAAGGEGRTPLAREGKRARAAAGRSAAAGYCLVLPGGQRGLARPAHAPPRRRFLFRRGARWWRSG
jgi:hypothetical protein